MDIAITGQAQVSRDRNAADWNGNFINPDVHYDRILWSMLNFVYLRIFDCNGLTGKEKVCMYIESCCNPSRRIPLYTDMRQTEQSLRMKDDKFATNAHPFIISGQYDWTGYRLVATLDNESAVQELVMDDVHPFIVISRIPDDIIRSRRIHAFGVGLSSFDIEVSASMKIDLDVDRMGDEILFNGCGSRRIDLTETMYLILKEGEKIPSELDVRFESYE